MDQYQITINSWNNVAEAYERKFMDINIYNDSYDYFCNLILKKSSNIFEIGCGPGNITRYLKNKRPDFNIKAIDVAPNMIDLAKINTPDVDFEVMDCRTLHLVKSKYDGIMCGFCIPYISHSDTANLISNCKNLLKEKGILYVSTIKGSGSNSGYQCSSDRKHKMFIYDHSESTLVKLFDDNGFKILKLISINYPSEEKVIDTHLIYIVRKL